MMSNVSHELWTPLNAIISSSDIILNQIIKIERDKDNPILLDEHIAKLKKWSWTAWTSSSLLVHLVNDILDLGWLENEAFKLNIDYFSVFEVTENIKELFTV